MPRRKPRAGLLKLLPRLLLVIPFVAVLWVPFYNQIEPELGGVPFFYWYQLAWVLLSAAIVLAVYLIETRITGATERSKTVEVEPSGAPGDVL